ncbi:MAG: hypothetical protein KIT83_02470 [Bryobacterales bacterium]|nr:hypothetical protein [Bryobacterales bacterium]
MQPKLHFDEVEIRHALESILSSRTFGAKSAVHLLLAWLVNRALSDPDTPLKEYTIGVEAFGRPESYDPQHDAYVRVQAGKLRQKLVEYYATEGARDPIRIELPRRQFLPVFNANAVQPEAAAAPATAQFWKISTFALLVMLVAFGISTFRSSKMDTDSKRLSQELRDVWHTFMRSPRPVLISLGTHQFYSYQGGFLREPALDLATPDAVQSRLDKLATIFNEVPLRQNYGYTGTGQATAAFLLGRFFGGNGFQADLIRSSALTWDSIGGYNVIFLGSAKSNRQILSLSAEWAFSVEGESVINRRPREGEPKRWFRVLEDDERERTDFALISFVPGLHSDGELLVIESHTTTGIWAGAKYLTEDIYARELMSKLSTGGAPIPDHFQIVLRVTVRDAVPIKIVYETHRPF